MLKSKVSVLSYIGDVTDLRFGRQADQFVGDLADAGLQHCRSRLFQGLQIEPAIGADPVRTGSQLHHRRLDHGDRASSERTERGFPRRDGAADRPRQFRKILRFRRPRQGCRDFHVSSRWNDAGALPSRRFDDRTKFQDGAAGEQGADRGRLPDPARAKSGRRPGPARLGEAIEPFSDRDRRDHDRFGGAGRLARANQILDRRRRSVRAGHRLHSVPDHPADDPAKSGIAGAAEIGKAPARHRVEQHDAGPRAVRRIGASRRLQPALHRSVWTIDGSRKAGYALSRHHPAPQGDGILQGGCR